jgi:hypothetical protein
MKGQLDMLPKKMLMLAFLLATILAVAACTGPAAENHSGVIIMEPFTSEEFGICGIVPAGLPDQFALIQQSFPGTKDELTPVLLAQANLKELPESTGSYKGRTFTWDLYTFETQIKSVGPEIVRVDLALAEDDSASYLVALVTLPGDYDANVPMFETIFVHAVYALAPLE